jgi:hypothetical protein
MAGQFLLYRTEDGKTRVECRLADNTLWLSQALVAELFDVSVAFARTSVRPKGGAPGSAP